MLGIFIDLSAGWIVLGLIVVIFVAILVDPLVDLVEPSALTCLDLSIILVREEFGRRGGFVLRR